jgi:putative hemolysin
VIVGPIRDEFDRTSPAVEKLPDGTFEFSGGVPLPEVVDTLDLDLEEDTDTIGGYFAARLGRMPVVGDALRVGKYKGTVTAATRQRVTRVRFESEPPPRDDDTDSA